MLKKIDPSIEGARFNAYSSLFGTIKTREEKLIEYNYTIRAKI